MKLNEYKWKLSNTNVELYNTNEMYKKKTQWKLDHIDKNYKI